MHRPAPTSDLEANRKLAAGERVDEPGVVHDLGNLIQIAASAMNLIGRSPWAACDPSLEPVLARARAALERAGVLVRQALGRSREAALVVRGVQDLQDVVACLGELQSAVLNLVINARDAMPEGGCLSLAARALSEDDLSPGVAIVVSDDGFGMSPETLRRASNPFFTTKPNGRGTGLGLAMVQRFAHEAGGRADIASTVGVGTTVTLHLPSHTPADASPCEILSAWRPDIQEAPR